MHKNLPKSFIFVDKYENNTFNKIKKNIGIVYRNYNDRRRENQLIKVAEACKKNKYKLFISNDLKLVYKYKADGIYIPSFNKTKKFNNCERKNIIIIGSAHNQKEIITKIEQKCEIIFLSPVFFVKKRNNFLGLHRFNSLSYRNKVDIFALGGINHNNIRKLQILYTKGFGGIQIFKKKPAL
jgi:thiamine-phosphate pyrophosphorylase